jgi:hypothetical protein
MTIMTDTTIVAVPPATSSTPVIDWPAVIGGSAVAAALSFVLFAFGTSAGIAAVSPFAYNNPSATTVSIVSAAFFLLVMIGSFLAGGYFAGRFRRPIDDATLEEREVRDGANGAVVWGVSLLIGVALAMMVAGAAGRTAASVTGHAATIAGAGAATAATSDRVSGMVDNLLRSEPGANVTATTDEQRAALGRIFMNSFNTGTVSEDDKTYLIRFVAARAGVNEDEARKRVDAAIAQTRQAAENAKQAAEKARRATAILGFLIAAASLLSLGAAYWGATAGGSHRDQRVIGGFA